MGPLFWFILSVVAYTFVGSVIASRHHTLESRKCEYDDHFHIGRWGDKWCNHVYVSIWWFGLAWPTALITAAGFAIGQGDPVNRAERRRIRELDEASHKLKLAELARREDEELDMQLAAQRRQRQKEIS